MPKIDLRSESVKNRIRRTLTITVTRDCNLRCAYCYEKKADRIKDAIPLSVATGVIEKYLEADDGMNSVEIQFFGGEPMLAFHRIKDIVEWVIIKKWAKDYIFSICTNGTILTEEMKKWLLENKKNIIVGFSLDGCKTAHDISRCSSYDALMKNIPFFLEHWPNQFAKMTINAETIPYVAEGIIDLEKKEIPFTANVIFEDILGTAENKTKLLDIYADQLDKLVEFYSKNDDLFPATIVDRKIQFILGPKANTTEGSENVRFCGSGHEMLEVDIDGRISPCHRFAEWVTRNSTPIINANKQNKWQPDVCANCKLVAICPTCAGYNYEINGDASIRTTYHCETFKLEVLASAKLQAYRINKMINNQESSSDKIKSYEMAKNIEAIIDMIDNGV